MDFLNRLMKAPGAAKSTMGLHDRTLVAFSFEKCPISRQVIKTLGILLLNCI